MGFLRRAMRDLMHAESPQPLPVHAVIFILFVDAWEASGSGQALQC